MSDQLFLGHSIDDHRKVLLNPDDLVTHGLVVGRTGSGKTGLIHVLIEEAVMSGASVIAIDPKGDLTNLALSFPGLTPEEFAPWISAGKTPKEESARWAKGLEATGQELSRVADWHNAANVSIYTPGLARYGTSINLLPSFDPPQGNVDSAATRERASHIVSTILSALGIDADPMVDPNYVFLTEMLLDAWREGNALPLSQWSGLLVNPPESLQSIDGIHMEDFFSQRERMKLARALIGFRRQAARWLEGPTLDMDAFLKTDGRPNLSIFTLRHLNAEDRMMFVSMFLSCLVDWMYHAPASSHLKALCVLDEAAGYLPPHPYNPPTKRPITTLLAQGRAQGLGIVIGTQNPNDLDYKALSNVGTWFLGGLRERDMKRDLDAELSERGVDSSTLLRLPERGFLLLPKEGDAIAMKARWSLSYLRGPIDAEMLSNLAPEEGLLAGVIHVGFDLTLEDSTPVDVEVRYSLDGETWEDATPADESPSMIRLASSPTGIKHSFSWDSVHDLGFEFASNVRIAVHVKGYGTLDYPPIDIHNERLSHEGLDGDHGLESVQGQLQDELVEVQAG